MTKPPLQATSHAAPLHEQIYARIRALIQQGQLKPGQRVPSLRAFAVELGVARGTVQVAYDRLLGEGYLIAKGPAGTYVSEQVTSRRPRQLETATDSGRAPPARESADIAIEMDGGRPRPCNWGFPRWMNSRENSGQG
ncbi:hypothetical protein AWV79_14820 [Cupriavidus sp. UYMMa02A]|nr:hypothetical protein AWV79_14820 [Cupriavidus sp. UYMMa02A]